MNMRHVAGVPLIGFILLLLSIGQAWAQDDPEVPAGTIGSGAISLEQLTEELQFLLTEREEIVVHFVLPTGWEVIEQGLDPATGELLPELNQYILMARAPTADSSTGSDFIFELDIFKYRLNVELPEGASPEEYQAALGEQFSEFLNEMLSVNIRGGLRCTTLVGDIKAKPYGPETRPNVFFVPITYEQPETGAELYTFASFTGNTVWQLKFLVAKGQIENYGALIALILHETFALTSEDYAKLREND